jgi:hypothetical protein
LKTVNELVNEVFNCNPDMEIEFDQWIRKMYKPSLSLGMELDDLIRVHESDILRWMTNKIMELS